MQQQEQGDGKHMQFTEGESQLEELSKISRLLHYFILANISYQNVSKVWEGGKKQAMTLHSEVQHGAKFKEAGCQPEIFIQRHLKIKC